MTVAGVQAQSIRTYLSLTDASVAGDNATKDASTGAVHLPWNTRVSWTLDDKDLSGYEKLVINLSSASTNSIFVYLNDGGEFYPLNKMCNTVLAKDATTLTINLASLTHTGLGTDGDKGDDSAIDLTNVTAIGLFNQQVGDPVYENADFTIESIYLTPGGFDEVISTPVYNTFRAFTVSDTDFNLAAWPTENNNNTKNEANNSTNISEAFGAVAWDFATPLDISDCVRISFKGKVQGNNITLNLHDTDGNEYSFPDINHNDNTQEISWDISGALTKDDKTLDKTKISRVRLWNYWGCNVGDDGNDVTITIEKLALETLGTPDYSLIRENTASNKYGTICLPFAASKPSNATVYDVVGWNESYVYLQTVDALEAGKGYIFQSTDAEDITFTKTGAADNLTEPKRGNALDGYFNAATRYVPVNSYILVGTQWKKVTKADTNQVGLYRGYLTLLDDLKVSVAPSSARTMSFDGGETTGIETLQTVEAADAVYTLSGVQVKQPAKGLYIVNGKKVVIK